MYKYKITFKFDIDGALSDVNDDYDIDIEEFDDSCFDEVFNSSEKIKEFEKWYDEQLNISEIDYTADAEDIGVLIVTMQNKPNNEKDFAKEIVYYLFESDWPEIKYRVTGTGYEDYWDYWKDTHGQRDVEIDYTESTSIISFSDVTIQLIQ